jgi:DNA-binding transcriptional MerR regulator
MQLKQQWSPDDLHRAIGVSKSTLLSWEATGVIPKARRKGLNRQRIWDDAQAHEISDYFFYRKSTSSSGGCPNPHS